MTIPFWGGVPSCSKPHGPPGQQTPAAHSHRIARWGFSVWQGETWAGGRKKTRKAEEL